MFLRALFAFIALPGVVAFAVPAYIVWTTPEVAFHLSGAIVFLAGVADLLWCVHEFFVQGKGTLAPWSPPKHLVTSGLYRFTRNPMYVGVLLILAGWWSMFPMVVLAVYAAIIGIAFHLRVVFGEEPMLARTFGDWEAYRASVPRWFRR